MIFLSLRTGRECRAGKERIVEGRKRASFMLFLGRLCFFSPGGRDEPEVFTQSVNLAVRGTEYEVGSGYDGSTLVIVTEGRISVTGAVNELVLNQGEGTEIGFGEEPEIIFSVAERVAQWEEWFSSTRELLKGSESEIVADVRTRMEETASCIAQKEEARRDALNKRNEYMQEREKAISERQFKKVKEYLLLASESQKRAFFALVDARFYALSTVGLYTMADRIYSDVKMPPFEMEEDFTAIETIYKAVEEKYLKK